jgi:hypothetical protein
VKKNLAIVCLCVAAGFSLPATAQEKKQDPLVEAARKAKANRKTSSSKVLTNKDVKKSKGKLIVLDKPAVETPAAQPKTSSLVQQDERYRARKEAAEKVALNEKKVASLEKDLEAIEQRYYEENDPNYRDNVIQKRFAQARGQLDDARRELADARDLLKSLEGGQP